MTNEEIENADIQIVDNKQAELYADNVSEQAEAEAVDGPDEANQTEPAEPSDSEEAGTDDAGGASGSDDNVNDGEGNTDEPETASE